jgi:hypothetical protein
MAHSSGSCVGRTLSKICCGILSSWPCHFGCIVLMVIITPHMKAYTHKCIPIQDYKKKLFKPPPVDIYTIYMNHMKF